MKPKTKLLKESLSDVQKVCMVSDIDYRIIGSMAAIGAANNLYRIPNDIDLLYDCKKEYLLKEGLLKMGYKEEVHREFKIFPDGLSRFIKGESIIEPRKGCFIKGGFEVKLKYYFKLIFSKSMFLPYKYKWEGIDFIGLSQEALYISLTTFQKFMNDLEGDNPKREQDLKALSQNLNTELLTKIKNENSGIYFGFIPLATINKQYLLNLLLRLVK